MLYIHVPETLEQRLDNAREMVKKVAKGELTGWAAAYWTKVHKSLVAEFRASQNSTRTR